MRYLISLYVYDYHRKSVPHLIWCLGKKFWTDFEVNEFEVYLPYLIWFWINNLRKGLESLYQLSDMG